MSKQETPVKKSHASGSWRAIRSLAVPASVTSLKSSDAAAAQQSGSRKIHKVEEESVLIKTRKAPGYFENADPSFSNS